MRTPRERFCAGTISLRTRSTRLWTTIALHTTAGIPQYMHPVVALLTNSVEMNVLGIAWPEFSHADREAIVAAYARAEHFKEDLIRAFYDGIRHKLETTFGNVKADCTGGQGFRVPAHELLQCHPRFAVEGLRNRTANAWRIQFTRRSVSRSEAPAPATASNAPTTANRSQCAR